MFYPALKTVWFLLLITFIPLNSALTYDLIDPTPACYTMSLCTAYGEWGTYSSIHPNSEERTQHVMINLARMYPYSYKSSPYGKHVFGTFGNTEWEYDRKVIVHKQQIFHIGGYQV